MIGAVLVLALAAGVPQSASPAHTSSTAGHSAATHPAAPSFEQLAKQADEARQAQHEDEAIGFYRKALKLRPDWDQGLMYLGAILYEKKEYVEARDVLRHFIGQNPKHPVGWALLGLSEYHTREYDRSFDHLQNAMNFGVRIANKELANTVFYHVAVLLTRFGRYDDSFNLQYALRSQLVDEQLLESIGLAGLRYALLPEEIPADRREMVRQAGRGTIAVMDGRQADAEAALKKLVEDYPNEPGVHYLYGYVLIDLRPEDGLRELQEELRISPSHVPARLRLANYYLHIGQNEKAEAIAREAGDFEPDNATAHLLLGESLGARGNTAEAITELETARQLEPDEMRTHMDLYRAYAAAGRKEDADKERAEAQRLGQQRGTEK